VNADSDINFLVVLEASGTQSEILMSKLQQKKFFFTIVNSTSGIIQESISILMDIIHACCQPHPQFIPTQMRGPYGNTNLPMVETSIGGATIYTLDVEEFIQI
jgi:uncharacterized protein YaaQ